jgi:hypothetical protein
VDLGIIAALLIGDPSIPPLPAAISVKQCALYRWLKIEAAKRRTTVGELVEKLVEAHL